MLTIAIVLLATCAVTRSSGVPHLAPAPAHALAPAPVLATSSQYFQRNFNRLVLVPPALEAPAVPFAPLFPAASFIPAASILPAPPILVEPVAKTTPEAPTNPSPAEPSQPPNVAIAIATAQGAAPVATILLPPYPFGAPQNFGFFQRPQQVFPQEPKDREQTTTTTTTETPETTTSAPDNVLPLPSNTNFVQGLPSSEDALFAQYGAPKPAKLKTSVEVVPVPLAYIAPPPVSLPIRHVHTFVPKKAKFVIRPVLSYRVRPARIIITPASRPRPQWRRTALRDVEPTTPRPFSNIKPPRF